MEQYSQDVKTDWSPSWICALLLGFAGFLAILVLLRVPGVISPRSG